MRKKRKIQIKERKEEAKGRRCEALKRRERGLKRERRLSHFDESSGNKKDTKRLKIRNFQK
jgi:hypothetical protein